MIRQLLDDWRYRKHHRKHARDDGPRLVRLVDDPYAPWSDRLCLPFIGYRTWCDGRRRECPCRERRCCDCAHTERRP